MRKQVEELLAAYDLQPVRQQAACIAFNHPGFVLYPLGPDSGVQTVAAAFVPEDALPSGSDSASDSDQ